MKISGLKIFAYILAFSALLVMSGCSSKKTVVSGGVLLNKTQQEVFADVVKSEVQYNTISAKGSIGYGINGSGKKVSAVFKIERDKMMQVSVRFLGIEGARITITPDSIYAINRLKKHYVAESLSSLSKKIDFNYYNLQALLTNKLFLPGKQTVSNTDLKQFELKKDVEANILQAKGRNNLLYKFDIDGSDHIVKTSVAAEGDENAAIEWFYSSFIKDQEFIYPTEMSASMVLENKKLNLDISFSKLNINEKDFEISNTISSSYKKKTIKEFISALP